MISGRQALGSIDQALKQERAKIEDAEQRIEAKSAALVEQRKADTRDFRELAKVRVDLLAGGELVEHIDRAERQVLALLKGREAAARELEGQIKAAEKARRALEADREAKAGEVDRADDAVDAAQARTQARLDADPAYQAQRERAQEAERTARHAGDKATGSEQEKEHKGEAYRNDPLFMYLWERNYGLPSYEASPLIRWLDGKVARLIGFADARANYVRLNEIPERLREHAEGLKASAEQEFQALKELDTEAREADGIPALEAERDRLQAELDAVDERIQAAESDYDDLLARRAAFAAGEDEHTRKAVELLAAELRRDDVMELRRQALETPFPDDDLIVNRMLQREDEARMLEAAVQGLKETLEQHRGRLKEIDALRAEFKRQRYDRAGSSFSDGALIALMLGNFLNGMLDRQALWKILREQQRYRPPRTDPTFGSGGFGRGSVWGGDIGDILGGSRGRGGWGGGGGFRTGGGFGGGGGGFHTGGGF